MADIKTITQMLKEIGAAYPNWKASEDTFRVWTIYLQDVDNTALIMAVRKFISSSAHAFPPSIPEIRQSIGQLAAEAYRIPSAIEAWDETCHAKKPHKTMMTCDIKIDPRGWLMVDDPPHPWSSPLVETCARRFGWPNFPTGENDTADRAHFIRAYDEMIKNETARAVRLPQITEYIEEKRLTGDRQAAFETGERREVQRQLTALSRRME